MPEEKSKGKSLRDRIAANAVGGFFVTPSGDSDDDHGVDSPEVLVSRPALHQAVSSAPPVPGAADRAKIETYKQTLLEAVTAATPVPFTQFLELVETLRDPEVKESALYRLALKAAGRNGLTMEAIVQAAQARIDCLPNEQQAFEADCKGKEQAEVGGAMSEMEQLRQRRATIEEEMRTIDARMTALNETIGATTTRLAGDKASFSAAMAEVSAQVRAEKQTLQTNLGL